MKTSIVYLILVFVSAIADDCPDNVSCKSTLTSCPEGQYYGQNVRFFGCCPGCVTLAEEGEKCKVDNDCAPGLKCEKSVCEKDSSQKCEFFKRSDPIWKETKYWQPRCLDDGNYGPKQCKGAILDGKCFCSNTKGDRIFGERDWNDASNMTCGCSSLRESLAGERPDVTLHCNAFGNFEELQCDDRVCWCANERTGIPYSLVVPEPMLVALPCFDPGKFGSKYLRQCESASIAITRAVRYLLDHGTEMSLPQLNCNYDGSYARVQAKGIRYYCADKYNKKLTEATAGKRNCNCAYDEHVKQAEGKDFRYECDQYGDYKTEQFSDRVFLVDSDGFTFYVNDSVPKIEPYKPDLSQTGNRPPMKTEK